MMLATFVNAGLQIHLFNVFPNGAGRLDKFDFHEHFIRNILYK